MKYIYRLNESHGVAAYNYRKPINRLFDYIISCMKRNITAPQDNLISLLKGDEKDSGKLYPNKVNFDFIKNLKLLLYSTPMEYIDCHISYDQSNANIIDNVVIRFWIPINVTLKTLNELRAVVYHEFNHLLESYYSTKKGKLYVDNFLDYDLITNICGAIRNGRFKSIGDINNFFKNNDIDIYFEDDLDIMGIYDYLEALYRLSDTEINAYVSETYGELHQYALQGLILDTADSIKLTTLWKNSFAMKNTKVLYDKKYILAIRPFLNERFQKMEDKQFVRRFINRLDYILDTKIPKRLMRVIELYNMTIIASQNDSREFDEDLYDSTMKSNNGEPLKRLSTFKK